jgi:predicted unusual protein kinase regulating ubiquinone biosynthesis (AarF/ABC1/UbiB family)
MRGAAMKLGQLLSLEGGAGLPVAFADALASLQASGEAMQPAQLHRVLGRELGKGWRTRFIEFEEDPFASASIGQVHYAVTLDGRQLALKIQFPGIAKSIHADVDNLATLLSATGLVPRDFRLTPLMTEVKRQLRQETDYVHEAESLIRYRKLIADEPGFRIPAVHLDYSTSRVIALEYIEADPLASLWRDPAARKLRDHIGNETQRLVMRELFEFGFMQSDPNFANYLYCNNENQLVLLDFGSMVEISSELQDRYKRLLRATIADDLPGIGELLVEYGWLSAKSPRAWIDGLAELVVLGCEPIRTKSRYDFGNSDLADRVRDFSFDLSFRRGLKQPPPPELLFIQRKFAGTFQLSAKLGARVNARELVEPYLG